MRNTRIRKFLFLAALSDGPGLTYGFFTQIAQDLDRPRAADRELCLFDCHPHALRAAIKGALDIRITTRTTRCTIAGRCATILMATRRVLGVLEGGLGDETISH